MAQGSPEKPWQGYTPSGGRIQRAWVRGTSHKTRFDLQRLSLCKTLERNGEQFLCRGDSKKRSPSMTENGLTHWQILRLAKQRWKSASHFRN